MKRLLVVLLIIGCLCMGVHAQELEEKTENNSEESAAVAMENTDEEILEETETGSDEEIAEEEIEEPVEGIEEIFEDTIEEAAEETIADFIEDIEENVEELREESYEEAVVSQAVHTVTLEWELTNLVVNTAQGRIWNPDALCWEDTELIVTVTPGKAKFTISNPDTRTMTVSAEFVPQSGFEALEVEYKVGEGTLKETCEVEIPSDTTLEIEATLTGTSEFFQNTPAVADAPLGIYQICIEPKI